MAHALTAHFRACDLYAALIADNSLTTDASIFTAVAVPVLGWAEDALTEQSIFFRLECTVVDCLRFRDLTVAPATNLLRASKANTDGIKIIDFEHVNSL